KTTSAVGTPWICRRIRAADFSRSAASTNDTREQVETLLARGASAFLARAVSASRPFARFRTPNSLACSADRIDCWRSSHAAEWDRVYRRTYRWRSKPARGGQAAPQQRRGQAGGDSRSRPVAVRCLRG